MITGKRTRVKDCLELAGIDNYYYYQSLFDAQLNRHSTQDEVKQSFYLYMFDTNSYYELLYEFIKQQLIEAGEYTND